MFYTDLLIFILIEMLKNRSHSITSITLSQFEEVAEFLLSKFCCNDKSSSVMIGYLSIIPMVMSILSLTDFFIHNGCLAARSLVSHYNGFIQC